MPIELKMPALSPTMEEGTVAKWLVTVGDSVKPGDVVAEIETDKATMEFQVVDEGRITAILIAEGTDGVAVGTVIAVLASGGDDEAPAPLATMAAIAAAGDVPSAVSHRSAAGSATPETLAARPGPPGNGKPKASPLAIRIATSENIDLDGIVGSGAGGRIVRRDLGLPTSSTVSDPPMLAGQAPHVAPAQPAYTVPDLPHEMVRMTNMRKTIARRLTDSKQQVPHIYLTVDVCLDALLALRNRLNEAGAARGLKLSVNDFVIKALGLALIEVPSCNVQFAGDRFVRFARADISVAVSIPGGLITPVITAAQDKSLSAIAREMKDLAERARQGKLQPEEFQGGTASLSNLGMFGITQFTAVINPPQAMIMAVGAAGQRAHVEDGSLTIATMMTVTGSFDHRVIDGADAALFMQVFRRFLEHPLQLF